MLIGTKNILAPVRGKRFLNFFKEKVQHFKNRTTKLRTPEAWWASFTLRNFPRVQSRRIQSLPVWGQAGETVSCTFTGTASTNLLLSLWWHKPFQLLYFFYRSTFRVYFHTKEDKKQTPASLHLFFLEEKQLLTINSFKSLIKIQLEKVYLFAEVL